MKRKTKKMAKQGKWFIKIRGSYIPSSFAGWLTYIPYTLYLITVWLYVMSKNWDFMLSVFVIVPNWVAALAVMNYIATRKS